MHHSVSALAAETCCCPADGGQLRASAVVLAVGHSARAMYNTLHQRGVAMTAKPFAVGFRVEHPQAVINSIQYGQEYAAGGVRLSSVQCPADYWASWGPYFQEEEAAVNVYTPHQRCPAHTLPTHCFKLGCDWQSGQWAQQLLPKLKPAAGYRPDCLDAHGRTAALPGTGLVLATSNSCRPCLIRQAGATELASGLSEANEQMLHAVQQDTPLARRGLALYSCLASGTCQSAFATADAAALWE